MVVAKCSTTESGPNYLRVNIIVIRDFAISQFRIEGNFRWQVVFFETSWRIHIIVWIDSFPQKKIHWLTLEFGEQMFELLLAAFEKIAGELFQRTGKELKAVLELQVIAPIQGDILLHSLSQHTDLTSRKVMQGLNNQMTVITAKVMKEHWDLVCLSHQNVATTVQCATISSS